MDATDASRRVFLRAAGSSLGAAWVAAQWPKIAAAAGHAHEAVSSGIPAEFVLFTAAQARDVAAIAAQIVPGGDTPGALEAGVAHFIDRVHAGIFARNAPAFLAELKDFQDAFARARPGIGQFADLAQDEQAEYLRSVEASPFFGRMRFLTVLGLLALPSYGGNAHKVGWKLVGFVDRHVWEPPFGHYDRDYPGFEPYAKESRL